MTMSPEQYRKLRELGKLFEQGIARPQEMQELSELLGLINQQGVEFEDIILNDDLSLNTKKK